VDVPGSATIAASAQVRWRKAVWQCRSCKRREGDPAAEKRHKSEALGVYFGTRTLDEFAQKDRSEKLYRWYQLVQEFVARNLTFASDKLPAFSGMASRFSFLLGLGEEATMADVDEQVSSPQIRPLIYVYSL
jgi:hypothetical protein